MQQEKWIRWVWWRKASWRRWLASLVVNAEKRAGRARRKAWHKPEKRNENDAWRRQERKCGPRSEGTERRLAGPFGSDKEAMESLPERGDSSAMKKQGSHPGSPGRKRLFRFSFHLTPSWNTPLLHSLWAVRGHLLRNVDVLAQSFPNIWLACLLSFQPLNWDYKQWNEKLINAIFFFD